MVGMSYNSPHHPAPGCTQHVGGAKQGSESNQPPPISQIPGELLCPVQKPSLLHLQQQDSSWTYFFLTTTWPRRLVHPEGDRGGCKGWRDPEQPSRGRSWPCSFRAALQGELRARLKYRIQSATDLNQAFLQEAFSWQQGRTRKCI